MNLTYFKATIKMLYKNRLRRLLFNPNLQNCLEYFKTEAQAESRLALLTINSIMLAIGLLLLWASFTSIQEVAKAPGVIMPSGQNYSVQHLDGGIISAILVDNNQQVAKGQKLMILDPAMALAELNKAKDEKLALLLELIRFKAFLNDEKLTKQTLIEKLHLLDVGDFKLGDYTNNLDELVHNTIVLLEQQNIAKANEMQLLQQKVAKLEDEKAQVAKQVVNLQERLDTLAQTKQIYEKLKATQAVSKMTLMTAVDKYNEIEGRFLESEAKLKDIENNLSAEQQQIKTIASRYKEKALQTINDTNNALLLVKNNLAKAESKLNNLTIRSPADGIINGLNVDIASVIAPGAAVLEIVPFDKELVVDAKISTLDIGHIKINDTVNVRVSSYSYANYGNINGTIQSISASTFLGTDNKPFYKAIIALEKNYVGQNPQLHKIIPGMTVVADIKTGEKSLLAYLFKPIHTTFSSAFRER